MVVLLAVLLVVLGLVVVLGDIHITGTRQSAQYVVSDVVMQGPEDVSIVEPGDNAKPDPQNVQGDLVIRVITVNGPALLGADSTTVNVIFVSQVVQLVINETFASGILAIEHGAVSGSIDPLGIAGGNTLGILDSVLSDQQVDTTAERTFDVKKAGSSHRLVEVNSQHQADEAQKHSEVKGAIVIQHVPLDLNDSLLARQKVVDENDVSHAFIDNIAVVNIGTADGTRCLVKKFAPVGEEGTRLGRGAVISLTSHHDSGHIIGETVAKTSKGELNALDTFTEHIDAIKKHNKITRDDSGSIVFEGHEVTEGRQGTILQLVPGRQSFH